MPTSVSTPLHLLRSRRTVLCTAVAATLVLQAGCGGSDGSDSSAVEPVDTVPAATTTGRFVDAAVGNLGYRCTGLSNVADTSGVTDSLGQFDFVAGQDCSFSVGGVKLGTAPGAALVTPVSLVPGASAGVANATVTNIVRFLLSIDGDSVPDNGIGITAEANAALAGKTLDFASANFDVEAAALIAAAIPGRSLATAATADAHLDVTLLGLFSGGYACTYSGIVGGTERVLGNVAISIADGVITGSGTDIGGTDTFEVGGKVSSSGAANQTRGTTSTGATFEGQFVSDGSASGTQGKGKWSDSGGDSGTWTCQHS